MIWLSKMFSIPREKRNSSREIKIRWKILVLCSKINKAYVHSYEQIIKKNSHTFHTTFSKDFFLFYLNIHTKIQQIKVWTYYINTISQKHGSVNNVMVTDSISDAVLMVRPLIYYIIHTYIWYGYTYRLIDSNQSLPICLISLIKQFQTNGQLI